MGTDTKTSDGADRREQRRRRKERERRKEDGPTSPPVATAALAIAFLIFLGFLGVRGVQAIRGADLSGPSPQVCRITDQGVAARASSGGAEPDQLAEGRVGDTYESEYGCFPGDLALPSD